VSVAALLRTVIVRLAWTVIAVLVALGTAGIVSAMNQPPGSAARPELTWAGDARMETALEAATGDLQALSDRVDDLAGSARTALEQTVAGDAGRLGATITEGTTRLGEVQRLADDLEASLAGVPYTGPDWALYVSAGLRHRYDQLAATSGLTTGLEEDWASFTGRSLAASRLTSLLGRHDEETAAAAKAGSEGRFKDALAQLDTSDATIAESRSLRDDLAPSTDVTTLTAWLDRNADYDAALRDLYVALIRSDGRVTDPVKKAFAREQAARAQLPGDTRALVVIMSDVAQGGLNQAVIAIEQARGSLAKALEVQQELSNGTDLRPPE
jgi:hypothetical protein